MSERKKVYSCTNYSCDCSAAAPAVASHKVSQLCHTLDWSRQSLVLLWPHGKLFCVATWCESVSWWKWVLLAYNCMPISLNITASEWWTDVPLMLSRSNSPILWHGCQQDACHTLNSSRQYPTSAVLPVKLVQSFSAMPIETTTHSAASFYQCIVSIMFTCNQCYVCASLVWHPRSQSPHSSIAST